MQSKGREDRHVMLPDEVLELLQEWWKVRPPKRDTGVVPEQRWLFVCSSPIADSPQQLTKRVRFVSHFDCSRPAGAIQTADDLLHGTKSGSRANRVTRRGLGDQPGSMPFALITASVVGPERNVMNALAASASLLVADTPAEK